MDYIEELEQMARKSRANAVYMGVYFALAIISLFAWFWVASTEAPLASQAVGYVVMLYCCVRCMYHCYLPQRLLRESWARMRARWEEEDRSPFGAKEG